MVLPNGFRPRDQGTRLAVGRALLGGAELPADDDGFAAACASVATPGDKRDGPLVSVVICTYNRAHLLPEAVASARAQDWPVEIVVVDDGSTDDTATWLASQPDLRVLRHLPNRGKPAALETGIGAARGEAFLVLDDDDRLFPGSVRTLAEPLFDEPSRVATWGDTLVFDHASGEVLDWKVATRLPSSHTRRGVLCTIPALPGATLVRTRAQRRLAPFEASLVRGQDMDHFLRLTAEGPVATVPLPILQYRKHDGLRGSAAAQWKKHADPKEHRRRFLACVQPVFRKRWSASVHGRDEGFAWALGLLERDCRAEALVELRRWPGPYTPHEAWVRGRAGLVSAVDRRDTVLVIDDGDDGSLEATLAQLPGDVAVEVICPRPRDTIGGAQVFWPGSYRASNVIRDPRGRRIAFGSSPGWLSPPFDPALLPPLPAADAAHALVAALGWPLPARDRAVRAAPLHPFAQACRDAATHPHALAPVMAIARALPGWAPGRRLLLGSEVKR